MGNRNMNTTDGKLRQKAERISVLAVLWLEARTSPEEERELNEFVRGANLDSDEYVALFDSETLATLRLLNAESLYAEQWLDEAGISMPKALKERMSAHIHSLATNDKGQVVPIFARRLIRYGAAAAAVALMAFAGWKYFSDSPSPELNTPKKIIIAHVPDSNNSTDSSVLPMDNNRETAPLEQLTTESDITKYNKNTAEQNITAVSNYKESSKRRKKSNENPTLYADADIESEDKISQEEIERSIQLLEENLNMVMAYNTQINNKVTNDLILVDGMLNRVEDDLEYVMSSVGTLKRPQLDVDDELFISPATSPTDPISF